MKTLFHGSPHNITGRLQPSKPRGTDDFQTQKAVFFTDNETAAQIYAIVRDKHRKRKGWFIYRDQLHIMKPYTLNSKGYVYVTSTKKYLSDPINNPNQYAIPRSVLPKYRYVVRRNDIKPNNIYEYNTKEAFMTSAKQLLKI